MISRQLAYPCCSTPFRSSVPGVSLETEGPLAIYWKWDLEFRPERHGLRFATGIWVQTPDYSRRWSD